MEWIAYSLLARNETTVDHWYLAQIAREIRCVLSKKPNEISINDFVLKFKSKHEEKVLSPEERQRRIDYSKAYWKAIGQSAKRAQKANPARKLR